MIKAKITEERDYVKEAQRRLQTEGKVLLNGNYYKFLDYLLEYGQPFAGRPLPGRYHMGREKSCYYNAWRLVRSCRGTLRYVEGKCASAEFTLPFDHAWAIDKGGRVIDPTLQDFNGTGQSTSDHRQGRRLLVERLNLLA